MFKYFATSVKFCRRALKRNIDLFYCICYTMSRQLIKQSIQYGIKEISIFNVDSENPVLADTGFSVPFVHGGLSHRLVTD